MITAELYDLNMLASQSTTIFVPTGTDLNYSTHRSALKENVPLLRDPTELSYPDL